MSHWLASPSNDFGTAANHYGVNRIRRIQTRGTVLHRAPIFRCVLMDRRRAVPHSPPHYDAADSRAA